MSDANKENARRSILREALIPPDTMHIPNGVRTEVRKILDGLRYTRYDVGRQTEETPLSETLSCRFAKPAVVTGILPPPKNALARINPNELPEVVVNGGTSSLFVGKVPAQYWAPWVTKPEYMMMINHWAVHLPTQTLMPFEPIELEVHKGEVTLDSRAYNALPHMYYAVKGFFSSSGTTNEDRLQESKRLARIAYKAAKEKLGIECNQPGAVLSAEQLLNMASGTPAVKVPDKARNR